MRIVLFMIIMAVLLALVVPMPAQADVGLSDDVPIFYGICPSDLVVIGEALGREVVAIADGRLDPQRTMAFICGPPAHNGQAVLGAGVRLRPA